jgi:conserved oligomeric Golgi complex subunit 3
MGDLQASFRDEILHFKPSEEDLDYPGCLLRALGHEQDSKEPGPESQQATGDGEVTGEASGVVDAPQLGIDDPRLWYPPLRQTLVCLAKLYHAVEPAAFSGLGQDALLMCTHSVQQASKIIEKQAGALDAHLFTIRHLLLLREQISSFQADFRSLDRDLDFSHVRVQLQRLLAGEVPLLTLAQSTAVLQMVTQGSLRVQENQVDGKRELEKALKAACEAFIMTVTQALVEPILSFLTKVSALRAAQKVRVCLTMTMIGRTFLLMLQWIRV